MQIKKITALSLIAALNLSLFADNNMSLQEQIKELKTKLQKLEKQVKKNKKTATEAKTLANGNHLKWDVDFRTTYDTIDYTLADGSHAKNGSLIANRLLVNMKYDAGDHVRFYSTLAFNKAFGQTLNSQPNNQYYKFDWVTNEALSDDTVKVREAYWLYSNDTFFGKDISWTASIGRRPSMDGLGANFREGQKRKSALAHTVNVQFDGASFRWNLENVLPLEGSWIKFCLGRGLTSAKPRFSTDGYDYAKDENYVNSDMYGVILVPYDDGQYSLHLNYAKSYDMIGFDKNDIQKYQNAKNKYENSKDKEDYLSMMLAQPRFKDVGDLDLGTVMFKAEGIGDGINDFLDDTIFFASYAWSKTHPKNGHVMLGSPDSQTGHSYWIGLQMPGVIFDDARWGVEYNHGSKWWRSVTYGEDTMVGSKVAARGDAKEIYWIKPLTKSLSMSLRYTRIDYDYTGSNSFFGAEGAPMTMAEAKAAGMNPVEKAEDVRVLVRYKY